MERFALDGYVVEELIGFGGTGEVWRAREVDTGEVVALKRLRARGAAATERLRREAGLLQTVAGPHVIGLRRMVVDDDEAVMVMDYAAGGNLATVLVARGRLPAPEVVTVIAPIAEALAAAHARDLIHADLTPANILFSEAGRPLLADFGVARAMGAASREVEATIDFLDPVVAAGGLPTPASDVFALAAVAFAALTGHSLWGTGPPEALLARAARGARPPIADAAPEVAPELAAVLESMLSADPDQRPAAGLAGKLILRSSAVAPVQLMRPPAPIPPPAATQVVRPALRRPIEPADDEPWAPWRRRIVIAGAAALGLVGAVGVGASLANVGHSQPRVLAGAPGGLATASPVSRVTSVPSAPSRRSATPRPTGSGTPPVVAPPPHPARKWLAIVTRLDSLRAQAFAAGNPSQLAAVYAPDSPAYTADVATLQSLARRGLHAAGFAATVQHVTVVSGTATTERLRVIDELTGYRLVNATGTVVGHGAARSSRQFTMELADVAGSWRVEAIDPP